MTRPICRTTPGRSGCSPPPPFAVGAAQGGWVGFRQMERHRIKRAEERHKIISPSSIIEISPFAPPPPIFFSKLSHTATLHSCSFLLLGGWLFLAQGATGRFSTPPPSTAIRLEIEAYNYSNDKMTAYYTCLSYITIFLIAFYVQYIMLQKKADKQSNPKLGNWTLLSSLQLLY